MILPLNDWVPGRAETHQATSAPPSAVGEFAGRRIGATLFTLFCLVLTASFLTVRFP